MNNFPESTITNIDKDYTRVVNAHGGHALVLGICNLPYEAIKKIVLTNELFEYNRVSDSFYNIDYFAKLRIHGDVELTLKTYLELNSRVSLRFVYRSYLSQTNI